MSNEKTAKQLLIAKRLVLFTIIIYISAFFIMNSSYLTLDNMQRFVAGISYALTTQQLESKDTITFTPGNNNCFGIYKDGFVLLTQNLLTIYSKDGYIYSQHTINLKNPALKISDKYILCFDRGGTSLYLSDSFNIIWKKEFESSIINAAIDDNGYLAVATDRFEYKGMVSVFSPSFTELIHWYSDSYILDMCFAERYSVSVITLFPNKENTDTNIHILNYKKGEETNFHVIENKIPFGIKVKEDTSVEILTAEDITSLRRSGHSIIYTYKQQMPHLFYQDERYSILAYLIDIASDLYAVEVIDSVGNKSFSVEYSNLKAISCFRDVFLILADNNLYTLNNIGEEVLKTEVKKGANEILCTRELVLVCGADFAQRIDIFAEIR